MPKAALYFLPDNFEAERIIRTGEDVDCRFDKSLRLLDSHSFQAVFDNSKIKVSSAELLFLAHDNDQNHARLGLVIAKKNVRLAVQRNRIKRVVRETFRHEQSRLPAIDVIVLARRGVDQLENAELHRQCQQLWRQLDKRARKIINRREA